MDIRMESCIPLCVCPHDEEGNLIDGAGSGTGGGYVEGDAIVLQLHEITRQMERIIRKMEEVRTLDGSLPPISPVYVDELLAALINVVLEHEVLSFVVESGHSSFHRAEPVIRGGPTIFRHPSGRIYAYWGEPRPSFRNSQSPLVDFL